MNRARSFSFPVGALAAAAALAAAGCVGLGSRPPVWSDDGRTAGQRPPAGSGGAWSPADAPASGRAEGVRPNVTQPMLDPRGLDPRWSFYLGEPIERLWVVDDTVYAFTAKRNLYAIGLDDGFVRWQYGLREPLEHAPAAYSYKRDGVARTDELFLVTKDVLHCLDKDAGFALWKKKLPFAASSGPAASISHVYVGSWDDRVYAIDKEDQSIGWSYRTGAPVTARADAAEKTVEAVYVASEDGSIYAMNPVREERKWSYETRGAIVARPVFFKGAYVYAGSKDFNLYCIRALDGNLEWRYPTGAPITQEPVGFSNSRDLIYVVSGESNLLAVRTQPDPKQDYVRWRFDRGIQVVAKGRRDVYVLDTSGDIVALADDTGKVRWEAPLRTSADFHVLNPFDPASLVERERRLASTIVLGWRDGWLIAVKEKSEF